MASKKLILFCLKKQKPALKQKAFCLARNCHGASVPAISGHMPYKLRSFSLYRKMRKNLDRLLRIAGLFLAVAGRYQGEERGEGAIRVVKAIMRTAINSYFIVDVPNELVFQREAITFASFPHFECYRRFRLRKTHLQLVFDLLQFPTEIKSCCFVFELLLSLKKLFSRCRSVLNRF